MPRAEVSRLLPCVPTSEKGYTNSVQGVRTEDLQRQVGTKGHVKKEYLRQAGRIAWVRCRTSYCPLDVLFRVPFSNQHNKFVEQLKERERVVPDLRLLMSNNRDHPERAKQQELVDTIRLCSSCASSPPLHQNHDGNQRGSDRSRRPAAACEKATCHS